MKLINLVARANIDLIYKNEIEETDWNSEHYIPYSTYEDLDDIFEYDLLDYIEEYMTNKVLEEHSDCIDVDITSIKLEEAFYKDYEDIIRCF